MLISADASALEWRVVAELSGDPTANKEIKNGIDQHSLNQKEFNLPDRLTSKLYLFRTIFNRGQGFAFSQDPIFMHVSTSVKFWDDVGKKFYSKYKKIDELYDINLQKISLGQPIVGPLGREWLLEPFTTPQGQLKLPVTKAVNYPVQGTGADVMMLARISFFNRIKKATHLFPYVKPVSTVHDSILLDVNHNYVDKLEIASMFHQVFADLPANIYRVFGYKWTVPLACEVKAGPNMKDMKEIS